MTLVVVDSNFGKDLRMYRWQKRNEAWKVHLCKMSVDSWNWDSITAKAEVLIQKYEIDKKK